MKKTLAIDFDGVLHRYSKGWHDGSLYDPPMDGALEAIDQLLSRYDLVVFTARGDQELDAVRVWINQHFPGWWPQVTNTKPWAFAYIDDRAIRFINWENILKELSQNKEKKL